ncbi:Helix-turn-helix domain protein [Elizabethkingia miricola]|nr:Helix-turn-helix domain protein [Elizabethkingia miricola]
MLFYYILISTPIISSITFLTLFIWVGNQLNDTENKIRKYLIIYFALLSISFLNAQLYGFYESILKYFIPLVGLLVMTSQIIFYQFFSVLTPLKNEKKNIKAHYLAVFAIFLVLSILMSNFIFMPSLSGVNISDFFSEYTLYSTLLSRSFYSYLEIVRLLKFKKIVLSKGEDWSQFKWLEVLMLLSVLLILSFILTRYVHFLFSIMAVILICARHIIIVYNILNRNGIMLPQRAEVGNNIMIASGDIVVVDTDTSNDLLIFKNNVLDQSAFEDYFEKEKPYTNPKLKLEDLAEQFNTNRTYISKFINSTYELNASQYINKWRIKEVQDLLDREENKDKTLEEIAIMAGFSHIRNYNRAKKNFDE